MSTTVAFIGLGSMGGQMAAHLVKAGHRVRGNDLDAIALNKATAAPSSSTAPPSTSPTPAASMNEPKTRGRGRWMSRLSAESSASSCHPEVHGGLGGEAEFAEAWPLLETMGRKAVHCGAAGTGSGSCARRPWPRWPDTLSAGAESRR